MGVNSEIHYCRWGVHKVTPATLLQVNTAFAYSHSSLIGYSFDGQDRLLQLLHLHSRLLYPTPKTWCSVDRIKSFPASCWVLRPSSLENRRQLCYEYAWMTWHDISFIVWKHLNHINNDSDVRTEDIWEAGQRTTWRRSHGARADRCPGATWRNSITGDLFTKI